MTQRFSFKKPWLFYDYLDMQKTIDEGEIYLEQGLREKESQFKKPYKAATHPHSENEFSKPGTSGSFGPGGVKWPQGGEWPGGDCTVTGDAIGGGAIDPCNPSKSCGQWIFYCAHRISRFDVLQGSSSYGWIQGISAGPNDTVIVTVCWDEGERADTNHLIGINAYDKTGNGVVSKYLKFDECLGPGHDSACTNCADCKQADHPPTLAFQSQQMNVNGTQALYATGGGGGPYHWEIVSGGGTLSQNTTKNMQSVTYTAPASNAQCANNPTIRVTDYCGNTKDLKIAVNADGTPGDAYRHVEITGSYTDSGNCARLLRVHRDCVGGWRSQFDCAVCQGLVCGGVTSCWIPGCGTQCSLSALIANCNVGVCDFGCTPGAIQDVRTDTQKANGCCPAALL